MSLAAEADPVSGAVVAIRCDGLTKDYGQGNGVFDLDLQVGRGEVFGFVGPNGSGKSTTIRLLMNLISADRGSARIFGLDTCRHSTVLKKRLGYLPGELPHYPGMRARQVVTLLANLRGGVPQASIDGLAERFALNLDRKYSELSHGNKQKVSLVQAFMHDPELLILDEPTLGLDPLMQHEFIGLVRQRAAAGVTVLLSSHVLSEVQVACDRIGLVRTGRLMRTGTLDELRTIRRHRVTTPTEQYMSFAAELVGPVVAAYVIVQASGWVADAQQGRLDMILSTPRSPYRVVLERVGASATGALLVTFAGFVGLLASAALVGVSVSWPGLTRTALMSVAFAVAMAGVAACMVAWLPSAVAVGAMAALLAAMYLLEYLIPMLGWPEAFHRLSLFWAFGHPYLGWPTAAQLLVLAVAACGGSAVACFAVTPHRQWLTAVHQA